MLDLSESQMHRPARLAFEILKMSCELRYSLKSFIYTLKIVTGSFFDEVYASMLHLHESKDSQFDSSIFYYYKTTFPDI